MLALDQYNLIGMTFDQVDLIEGYSFLDRNYLKLIWCAWRIEIESYLTGTVQLWTNLTSSFGAK